MQSPKPSPIRWAHAALRQRQFRESFSSAHLKAGNDMCILLCGSFSALLRTTVKVLPSGASPVANYQHSANMQQLLTT